MNRDEVEGKAEQVKGKVKQAAGDLTDDEQLHGEGVADEAAGSVQEGYGKARRKVGEAIEDIGNTLKAEQQPGAGASRPRLLRPSLFSVLFQSNPGLASRANEGAPVPPGYQRVASSTHVSGWSLTSAVTGRNKDDGNCEGLDSSKRRAL